MRNEHEILIVNPAHVAFLLPERIFADDDAAHSLFDQKVNDGLACSIKIVIDLTIALVGAVLHLPRDTLSLLFGKAQLEFFHAFVVPLIPGFEHSTVNQSRNKALSV